MDSPLLGGAAYAKSTVCCAYGTLPLEVYYEAVEPRRAKVGCPRRSRLMHLPYGGSRQCEENVMIKYLGLFALGLAMLVGGGGVARAQFPILDMISEKVVQKYA